jgi:DNA-binding NarL/FixJ family response regulator
MAKKKSNTKATKATTKKVKVDRFAMNRVAKEKPVKIAKVKAPKEKKVTKRELCVKFYGEGMTNEEIAKAAVTTVNSVRWYLNKAGLKSNRAKKDESPQQEA